ncbi:MAG: sulfurtransferase TusA family protein [Oscillospiraceae bacterium]|nr:sulfurtransferase TusA family protein [Oscillospiraceae bacterium]
MIKIDVRGLSCPEPLLKLKQAIDGANEIELLTDSQSSVDNCTRFAESKGFSVVTANSENGEYTMNIKTG